MDEEEYKKKLADAGVDIPEVKADEGETPEQKAEAEAKAKEEVDAKAKAEADAKAKTDADANADADKELDPTQKKRSIYDDYKEKKEEAQNEKQLREKAEQERDEFKTKLEALEKAKTPDEKKEALDEFDEFAKEIEADPAALKKMRDLFLKGIAIPDELKQGLAKFQAWEKEQAQHSAKAQFETEYTSTLPALKTFFPKANDAEMQAIKTELDKISHSKGWNDKDLEYIAFKHKESLSTLVSPKKRGMESVDRKDDVVVTDGDFDPNADYSKMSPAQKAVWEKQYNEIMKKSDGLIESANGKKMMI